jgi:hypothetical protein
MQTATSYLDFSRHSQRGDNINIIEKVNAKDTIMRPNNPVPKNRPDGRLSKYPEVPVPKNDELSEIRKSVNSISERLVALESRTKTDDTPISPDTLSLKLAELGKMDKAQVGEVVKLLPEAFKSHSDSQIIRFIRGMK